MKRDTQPAGPPAGFLNKMQRLLPPEEYARFVASYDQPGHAGLRVNTLKISSADFSTISPFPLEAAGAWEPAGFYVEGEARPGRHPYHDAGLYYLQEPSAMVPAALLDPAPGDWVLDLAAAPGGKSTQLLSRLDATAAPGSALTRTLNASGLLVANDVHAARARILAGNLARWGAANTLTLNDEPERIAAAFGPRFDRVLLDAPCSGEGMFRRQGGFEWSEAMVMACARRQTGILDAAARLVRPGGRLVYSTCTFSPEEDEDVIAGFLSRRPAFALLEPPRYEGFDPGEPAWAEESSAPLERAVRLWPQRFAGEGHFIALMECEPGREQPVRRERGFAVKPPAAAERVVWRAFAGELTVELPDDRLHAAGGRLYLLPADAPVLGPLRLVRYGLPLGELRPGYFRPSHDLALALRAEDAGQAVAWAAGDERLGRYLAGEDIADAGPDGWTLVTVDDYGLGWAKRAGGRLKNHYPRALRRMVRG